MKIKILYILLTLLPHYIVSQNLQVFYDIKIKKDALNYDKQEKNSYFYGMYIQAQKDINNYPMEFIISHEGYSIDFSQSLEVEKEIQKLPVPKSITLAFVGLKTINYNDGNNTYITNDNKTVTSHDLRKLGSWEISQKTKNILGYTCYKAYFSSEVEEIKKSSMITPEYAWFTNEIPMNGGPTIFGNLPGLILEIETKACTIKANLIKETNKDLKKINFDNKEIITFYESRQLDRKM